MIARPKNSPTPHLDAFKMGVAEGAIRVTARPEVVNRALDALVSTFGHGTSQETIADEIALLDLLTARIEQYYHDVNVRLTGHCNICQRR